MTSIGQDSRDITLKRLAAIGEMSAGIAHEIRNPLTSVRGFLQLLEKQFPHRYWDVVFSELDQAVGTVKDLLTVAKPGMDDESLTEFSLCLDLESILYLFHDEFYRVRVEKRFYDSNARIVGKRNQIKRAVFNLLKNAFESIEGSGTVLIEHSVKDGSLYLVIQDSGCGMPQEYLDLLGTPFFTTKNDGVGMGLTLVYATFYEHGADITVTSTPGEGTRFAIRIPLSSEDTKGTTSMETLISFDRDIKDFFNDNREAFNRELEREAKTTFEVVSHSTSVTTTDLRDHANQIMIYVHDGVTQEIIKVAQERGIAWARSDVPLVSKMEWFYALRKVIWRFLREYHLHAGISAESVFELSDRISDALDNFIIHFNVSFTKCRDEMLKAREAIIDELTVPVIPIFNQIAILPLIGTLDQQRMRTIEERVLDEVESRAIQKIFIDLSGAALLDSEVLKLLLRVADGISLFGCKAVLTGIRSGTARLMLDMFDSLTERVSIEGTLQQALMKESALASASRD